MRNLIGIYKPWLTWLMPRRNFAMWSFSALLICGAGLVPAGRGDRRRLADVFSGRGRRDHARHDVYGCRLAVASAARSSTLAALALAAYDFPKIGKEYMPPLDEGSFLDMPVTSPRVSVTQVAADLKIRDAIIRVFPKSN